MNLASAGKDSIMEKLIEIFKEVKSETDIDTILSATDLYGQGVIDSLDIIVLADEICAAFDIEITSASMSRKDFLTVKSIYDMIERHGF
jgi:acyl carrier protein